MKKSDAINKVNSVLSEKMLNNGNTRFASKNARKNVCWFDIPLDMIVSKKFESLYLIVSDEKLYLFEVPTEFFRENFDNLVERITKEQKRVISLELSVEDINRFVDVRPTGKGVDFSRFVREI